MATRYYLAYGSNLNVEQMKRRCPDAKIVGVSEIKGYRLLFKGSKSGSYLTIEKAKGYSVPVAIWSVSTNDEKNLDMYEGYPNFYYKKDFEVVTELANGTVKKKLKAFAYIMDERRSFGIPTDYYVRTCLRGYRSFDFDIDYLSDAFDYSYEMVLKAG